MPPKKKASAPANRVYKKQPQLEQATFPARRTRVKTTYGRHAPRPIPKLLQQETLTQIGYVVREGGNALEEEDEIEEVEEVEEDEVEIIHPKRKRGGGKRDAVEDSDEEDDEVEIIKPKKSRRGVKRDAVEDPDEEVVVAEIVKPKKNRRRTMGDIVEDLDEEVYAESSMKKVKDARKKRRKTAGDKVSSPLLDQTTITQMYKVHEISSEDEEEAHVEEDLPLQRKDEIDTSFDDAVFDVPSSSQALPPSRNVARESHQEESRLDSPKPESNHMGLMGPPQTPKRIFDRVIPSSESPVTPLSTHSLAHEGRAPLTDISVNGAIPLNLHPGRKAANSSHQLPPFEIKDTFDTDESQMIDHPISSPKRSSPAKSVRFALPNMEIPDSDDDGDDDDYENYMDSPVKPQDSSPVEIQAEESPQRETCYGDIGEETQFEMSRVLGSSPPRGAMEESQGKEDSPVLGDEEAFLRPPMLTQAVTFQTGGGDHHNDSEDAEDYEDDGDELYSQERPTQFEAKTQWTESQRLHTQHYAAMAPRTIDSDVFVSLAAPQLTDIINRKRDHDIRNWAYPSTVARIWVYVAKPVFALKYMAVIGEAKRPGELKDETGLGNKVFNSKKESSNWHAYEIRELYELADPLPLSKLVDNEWLKDAPKKHMPVRPAVIDSLMANLMPPIFDQYTEEEEEEEEEGEGEEEEELPVSTMNDTQAAEAQLLSTMKQFTHIEASRIPDSSPLLPVNERIPLSQEEMLPPPFAKPIYNLDTISQATTVDLTQTQPQTQLETQPQTQFHTPRKPPPTTEIIWESPTRPVFSSTPARLPTPRSGGSEGSGAEQNSLAAPYSIASSQVLSETQMQKEGMFYDSIPVPPTFIQDSDEEDEDEDEL